MINRKQKRKYAKSISTPQKLAEYAREIENKLRREYTKYYEKKYQEELEKSISDFILSIIYTLHFNEKTKFGNSRIDDFMKDLLETVDMFRRKEAVPGDYIKQLNEDGINLIKERKQ